MSRTQDEIVARIKAVAPEDWLGFRTEVLVNALDFEHAKPWLKDDTTPERWDAARAQMHDAASYLEFAIGKILDHRGISASRSTEKLAEYAWLAARDDVVAAMDAAEYAQYGAPKVKAFAEGMGLPWPKAGAPEGDGYDADDMRALDRMADGSPCRDGCESGCGS